MTYALVVVDLLCSESYPSMLWFKIILQGSRGQLDEVEEEIVRSVMEQSVYTAHMESVTTGSQADILSLPKYRYMQCSIHTAYAGL